MSWLRLRWVVIALAVITPILLFGAFAVAVAVTPLPTPQTPQATVLLDNAGNEITRLFVQNREEIPLVSMPQHLLDAIVAVEDDRFYSHPGVDPIGIGRALFQNIRAGRIVQGGSTLTQQLVKNLYLTEERTVTRKLKEAVLAVKVETVYSKPEILGMYWNTIYLGQGVYGVQAAAKKYFGKGAADLTLSEAAFLAGLPRSPEYYSSPANIDAAEGRRNLVLSKMAQQGFITPDQAALAQSAPLVTRMAKGAPKRAPAKSDSPTALPTSAGLGRQ